jgi:hypothetical protein
VGEWSGREAAGGIPESRPVSPSPVYPAGRVSVGHGATENGSLNALQRCKTLRIVTVGGPHAYVAPTKWTFLLNE